MVGIYKITSPTGRIYIGQSIDIMFRWKTYNQKLKKNSQPRLYRSFLKHGVENHIFEIIEECEFDILDCRERHYQEVFDTISKNGLNCTITKCGENKMKYLKGLNSKSIEVYDTFYHIHYASIGEASEKSGIYKSQLRDKLSGKIYNNTRFVYKKDWDENIFKELKVFKYGTKVIDTITFQVFDNVSIAAEIYNIPKATLYDYLNERVPNKTNLVYLEEIKRQEKNKQNNGIKLIDCNGMIYKSISEAALKTGINISTIRYQLKKGIGNLKAL